MCLVFSNLLNIPWGILSRWWGGPVCVLFVLRSILHPCPALLCVTGDDPALPRLLGRMFWQDWALGAQVRDKRQRREKNPGEPCFWPWLCLLSGPETSLSGSISTQVTLTLGVWKHPTLQPTAIFLLLLISWLLTSSFTSATSFFCAWYWKLPHWTPTKFIHIEYEEGTQSVIAAHCLNKH